jgi:hypothetical protein
VRCDKTEADFFFAFGGTAEGQLDAGIAQGQLGFLELLRDAFRSLAPGISGERFEQIGRGAGPFGFGPDYRLDGGDERVGFGFSGEGLLHFFFGAAQGGGGGHGPLQHIGVAGIGLELDFRQAAERGREGGGADGAEDARESVLVDGDEVVFGLMEVEGREVDGEGAIGEVGQPSGPISTTSLLGLARSRVMRSSRCGAPWQARRREMTLG